METCKLLIKSMPCEMEELAQLIQELNLIIPRSLNNFGRRRAILEYVNPGEAQLAYNELKGLDNLLDKPLRLSPFGNKSSHTESGNNNKANKSSQTPKSKQDNKKKQLPADWSPEEQDELNKYVQKASQPPPPPPYLRYSYPSINNDILAAISQSLVNNTKFYYQVLHLMNRMNLEPPFKKRQKSLLQTQYRPSVGTQTEDIMEEETAQAKTLLSASESELESDTEAHQSHKPKRPCLDKEQEEQRRQLRLKKTRQMLHQLAKTTPHPTPAQGIPQPAISLPKIELKLPQSLTPSSVSMERLSLAALQALPIYRNYQEGIPSHKLYIKNLFKNVNEQQLLKLYGKYVTTVDHLEIKVMQQGRMKGQAFVTFNEEVDQSIVAQALSETNGLVWQQKPMIVCYGKHQTKTDSNLT